MAFHECFVMVARGARRRGRCPRDAREAPERSGRDEGREAVHGPRTAEEAGFYEHEGLDYLGIGRAMVVNLKSGRTRQGGSTITQQVVKNLLLDSERTYRRKIREALLSRRLEQELTKDEILELYLNH